MSQRGAAIWLAALLLAGCAAPDAGTGMTPHPPMGDATHAAPRFGKDNAAETKLLARYPDVVRRDGNLLRVASRGGWLDYRDTDCVDQVDACARYTLDQAWQNGRFFGVAIGLYEGGDYLVADTQSGHEFTGGPPVFSPNGGLFATIVYSESYPTSGEGVRIWATDFPMRNIRIVSPHVLAYVETPIWRGERCLSFTAVPAGGGDMFPDLADRRTYYLVEAQPEWRLQDEPAAICRD